MEHTNEKSDNNTKSGRTEPIIQSSAKDDDMTKEDRRRLVLEFMKDHPLAYSPLLLYRNLRLHRGATFTIDALRIYLEEFAEEGLVKRIEKDSLGDGKLVEAESGTRAYYLITDDGIDYVADNS